MARPWRAVRVGTAFEKSDIAYNERMATALLCSSLGDDLAVALDMVGWKITPANGHADRWPMSEPTKFCPTWAISVREQQHAISDGLAGLDGNGRGSNRKARSL
jgi:hypothetical protein